MKKILLTLGALATASAASYAQHEVSTNGQKHVIVHEGTGTWCGWCVDGALKLETMTTANNKIIGVGVHNGDAMAFAEGNTFNSAYAPGYPYGAVDCAVQNSDPDNANAVGFYRGYWEPVVNQRLALAAKFDLTMTHSFDKTTKMLTVEVTGEALEDMTGAYNLNVYVVEDSLTGTGPSWDQKNFYANHANYPNHPYYSKPALLVGYVHTKVLRKMLGGAWGVNAATNPKKNVPFSKTFTTTIANPEDAHNIRLVAVVQKHNATDAADREIYNSAQAKFLPWNPTSIEEASANSQVNIYPNPAMNVINVSGIFANVGNTATISIANITGQVVYKQAYDISNNTLEAAIPVNTWGNGIYLVNIVSEEYNKTIKVVVNH